jgi:hypothetical protein
LLIDDDLELVFLISKGREGTGVSAAQIAVEVSGDTGTG